MLIYDLVFTSPSSNVLVVLFRKKIGDYPLHFKAPKMAKFRLTHYHTMMHFDALKIYSCVENIVRKGEIACNKQFLLFSQCFLPYMALVFHFKCTFNVDCNQQRPIGQFKHHRPLICRK